MHAIEPYYQWLDLYQASEDEASPFYGRAYSEFEFTNTIYNYYIHPQWDDFGSQTLYTKILFADYEEGYAIMEFLGEWNDCINNDVMLLKREVIDLMTEAGITKFLLIGENVMNFHGSDDCYYEEWFGEVGDGWIVGLNFRAHVQQELASFNIDSYISLGGELDSFNWRRLKPRQLLEAVDGLVTRRLGY